MFGATRRATEGERRASTSCAIPHAARRGTLNEIAVASRVGVTLDETALPVPDNVRAACEMLGLDPLYVANEGVMLAIVPEADARARWARCDRMTSDATRWRSDA